MKKILTACLICTAIPLLAGCSNQSDIKESAKEVVTETENVTFTSTISEIPSESETVETTQSTEEKKDNQEMIMYVNDEEVRVEWEDNESVNALREICGREALTIEMSKYGGFEQVGEIGQSVVSDDEQITSSPGDIMLYSSDKIVVFYGSNSWAYTSLGKIKDKDTEELTRLFGEGDVLVKIMLEDGE